MCTPRGKTMWKHSKMEVIFKVSFKARREASEETKPASTLSLDFTFQNGDKINLCYLGYPVCGSLWRQPWQTNPVIKREGFPFGKTSQNSLSMNWHMKNNDLIINQNYSTLVLLVGNNKKCIPIWVFPSILCNYIKYFEINKRCFVFSGDIFKCTIFLKETILKSHTLPCLAMVLIRKSVLTLSTFGTRMEPYSGETSDG